MHPLSECKVAEVEGNVGGACSKERGRRGGDRALHSGRRDHETLTIRDHAVHAGIWRTRRTGALPHCQTLIDFGLVDG